MNTILFIGIFQALFLGLLVINKKNKSQSDQILILMLVYMALHQAFFLANFNDNLSIPLPVMIIGGGFPLLYGPILLWYVLSLIREKRVSGFTFIIHLIPYILFVLIFSLYHYFVEGPQVSVFDGYLHILGDYPYVLRLYSIYFAISGAVYPLISLLLLQQHRKNIHRQFSYEEEINLNWLRLLIIVTIATFILGFFSILFIVDWQWNENPRMAFYIISVVNTVFIFFIGYYGLRQTTIFSPSMARKSEDQDSEIFPDKKDENRYLKSGLDKEKSKVLFDRLEVVMMGEKPFLNGKLTLTELASRLEVSANHLSQAINENGNLNFFDYVNGYRVEEVKKLLNENRFDHYSLLGIGLECGFNSKSSFNQIFKDRVGQTPSQYKSSQIVKSGK